MMYIFDIDKTICESEVGRYENSVPKKDMIKRINYLYDNGNWIKILTGRGSTTGINQKSLTRKQLQEWGVKYHELKFIKKPRDYLYVDDKCCKPEEFLEMFEDGF